MSSGLTLAAPSLRLMAPKSLPTCEPTELSMGTPSTTKRALLLPANERFPLSTTLVAEPGPDEPWVTTNPATLPERVLTKIASRTSVNGFPPSRWVEQVHGLHYRS